ncbi:MAG: hypothetical protein PHC85_00390 [Candidatus Pacebacteria bacterium]|nr:hypothetical protein [Candidatus Paceibacterota bacterium]
MRKEKKGEGKRPDEVGEILLEDGEKRILRFSAESADFIRKLAAERKVDSIYLLTKLGRFVDKEGYKGEYVMGATIKICLL